MTAVPLGHGAYKRIYAGTPEVRLLNRWLEANPANLREGSSVLGRPGTTPTLTFETGDWTALSPMRGNYSLSGLFGDSLFVVSGTNLYKVAQDLTITHISGVINGTGHPEVAWQKGAGYERLWIADGLLLQFYSGTSSATGTLTLTGSVTPGTDVIQIGGVYYGFGTGFSPSDDGSASFPFLVDPKTDALAQLVKAIIFTGIPGSDYSSTIGGPNVEVTAEVSVDNPTTVLNFTARTPGTSGNFISTTTVGGTALAWTDAFLINGGIEALQGCQVPDGQTPLSLAQVSSYVLLSISNSQKFYWINPGEIAIDPLNFASKESSPDNISAMRTLGDQVAIIGEKSFENWYATGDSNSPFAPIEGRVYARGAVDGTAQVVDDGIFIVGDDGRVYTIGYQSGDASDIGWGVQRVSNNGIEERIRRQIRREDGLTP